jgi:hypothetical protein
MPTTIKPLRFGELIEELALRGTALVRGLGPQVHSYRGYYDRPAITPERPDFTRPASEIAGWYQADLDSNLTLYGWKGGEYELKWNSLVHYAEDGDTGPMIAGFKLRDDGTHELILIEEVW